MKYLYLVLIVIYFVIALGHMVYYGEYAKGMYWLGIALATGALLYV